VTSAVRLVIMTEDLGLAPQPSKSYMVAEPVVRQPWALRCWEAVAEEETAKVDEMLEVNLAHDDQRSAATIVPSGSGEPEQCSSTSVAVARGSLARRRVE